MAARVAVRATLPTTVSFISSSSKKGPTISSVRTVADARVDLDVVADADVVAVVFLYA
jgi:hypothetical protein